MQSLLYLSSINVWKVMFGKASSHGFPWGYYYFMVFPCPQVFVWPPRTAEEKHKPGILTCTQKCASPPVLPPQPRWALYLLVAKCPFLSLPVVQRASHEGHCFQVPVSQFWVGSPFLVVYILPDLLGTGIKLKTKIDPKRKLYRVYLTTTTKCSCCLS